MAALRSQRTDLRKGTFQFDQLRSNPCNDELIISRNLINNHYICNATTQVKSSGQRISNVGAAIVELLRMIQIRQKFVRQKFRTRFLTIAYQVVMTADINKPLKPIIETRLESRRILYV